MQIQINTDDQVPGRDGFTQRLAEEIQRVLGRFEDQLTRIEVHLGDDNAAKGGSADKHCTMEARPRGLQPIAVNNNGRTAEEALQGALKKMRAALDSKLGRLHQHKGTHSVKEDGAIL